MASDSVPATAKMVNQKTLRLHKIFDLYKNLAFLQNVEFLTCVGNNVTFPIRRGQNHKDEIERAGNKFDLDYEKNMKWGCCRQFNLDEKGRNGSLFSVKSLT